MCMQFHNFPIPFLGVDPLSRVSSVVGVLICANECSSSYKRMKYARVLVKVDITMPLVNQVDVEMGSGMSFVQKVKYECKSRVRSCLS